MKTKFGAAPFASGLRWVALSVVCATLSACGTTKVAENRPKRSKEYFSEKEYGVKASPRVATGNNIPKGGGRYLVGNPYQVHGKWYYPKEDFSYKQVGIASWYGSAFHGRLTANGEVYDQMHLSAAHPTLPLPSYARVTNLENGSSVIVRVNDRGPYHSGRIIDLSNKTADMLDMAHSGTGRVQVQYVGRARMDGHDMPYLMASYVPKGSRVPGVDPGGEIASGVMVASNSRKISRDELQSLDGYVPRAGSVPVPVSATSYGGSTPSARFDAAPSDQSRIPFSVGSSTSGDGIALPQIGPRPAERPYGGAGRSLAMNYAQTPVETVDLVFDAVMVRNDGLTQQSILASYKRQQARKADR